MKLERLIGIIFYLINRNKVTTNQLAKHFSVSKRTILRDIDTLTLAGIPIYVDYGINGGYTINKDFTINEKMIDNKNKAIILTALKSLESVYGIMKIKETYEKVKHIYALNEEDLDIDLSVITENQTILAHLALLKQAIQEKKEIEFNYTNMKGQSHTVSLNPLHTYYRWYAWYLFGYDNRKQDYRVYKLARIQNIHITTNQFIFNENIASLLQNHEQNRHNQKIELIIEYSKQFDILIKEYFDGTLIDSINNLVRKSIQIDENDLMTFSILLGLGDKIKILSPQPYKERIKQHLNQILL